MAFCTISTNPSGSAELFDQVGERLRESGEWPPEGAIFQVTGATPEGFKVVSVWESREAFERFQTERLGPAFEAVGANRGDISFDSFETHTVAAGNLSGVQTA